MLVVDGSVIGESAISDSSAIAGDWIAIAGDSSVGESSVGESLAGRKQRRQPRSSIVSSRFPGETLPYGVTRVAW